MVLIFSSLYSEEPFRKRRMCKFLLCAELKLCLPPLCTSQVEYTSRERQHAHTRKSYYFMPLENEANCCLVYLSCSLQCTGGTDCWHRCEEANHSNVKSGCNYLEVKNVAEVERGRVPKDRRDPLVVLRWGYCQTTGILNCKWTPVYRDQFSLREWQHWRADFVAPHPSPPQSQYLHPSQAT